jgi:glucose-1-phosphate adenylyltransferase
MADKIEHSLIGNRTRIEKGSTVIRSYIMGADYYQNPEDMAENDAKGIPNIGVGKFCYIENAILDKNCHIGNNVRIIGSKHLPDGDFKTHSIKDGIIVVKKDAIIKDGTVIP